MNGHAATIWVIIDEQAAFNGTGGVFSDKGTATFLVKVDKDDHDLKPKENKITFKMKDHGDAYYPDDPGFDQLLQLTTKNVICDKRGCPTVGGAVHDAIDKKHEKH